MLAALWWVCAHHHKEIRLGSPFYIDIKKVDFWAAKLCFELGLKFLFFDKKR